MSAPETPRQTERLNPVGSSELVRCEDYQAGKVRCPVVNCNDGTGRLLWQFHAPFEGLYDQRLEDYINTLPPLERDAKESYFQSLKWNAER